MIKSGRESRTLKMEPSTVRSNILSGSTAALFDSLMKITISVVASRVHMPSMRKIRDR